MDIPKIYIGGSVKRMIYPAGSPDISNAEDAAHTPHTVTQRSNSRRVRRRGAMRAVSLALTCIFCTAAIAATSSLMVNGYTKLENGFASALNREVFGLPQRGSSMPPDDNKGAVSHSAPEGNASESMAETHGEETYAESDAGIIPDTSVASAATDAGGKNPSEPTEENTAMPIARLDLSTAAEMGLELQNETKYSPELTSLHSAPMPVDSLSKIQSEYGTEAPVVLIIHTHGTESFTSDGAESCNPAAGFRSDNTDENIVAAGAVMAQTLSRCGVGTLHSTVMYDSGNYQGAYAASAAAVKEYLAAYPSIKYIFDVHRDSITRSDGTAVAPTAQLYGQRAAQVMIVAGTDEGGADHKGWENNLNVAAKLQAQICGDYPGLARKINLRRAAFNQGIAPGYLLMEIGSHANSLPEAKRSAAAAAISLAKLIGADTSGINDEEIITAAGE